MQRRAASAMFWPQLIVGVFLGAAGLTALVHGRYDLDGLGVSLARLFDQSSQTLNVLFAVVELVAGVLLVVALFAPIRGQGLRVAIIAILIVWLARLIFTYVFNDPFEPDVLLWLARLARGLIPATVMWMIVQQGTTS